MRWLLAFCLAIGVARAEDLVLRVDGADRRAVVAVPGGAGPFPVVVALHATNGRAEAMLDAYGWRRATSAGVLVVSLQALPTDPGAPMSPRGNPVLWAGTRPGDRARATADLVYLDAVLAEVGARWPIDPARRFLVGHNNGAAFAHIIVLRRPGLFKAAGMMSGVAPFGQLQPPGTRFMLLYGDQDPVAPLQGGFTDGPGGRVERRPAITHAERWAEALGCQPPLPAQSPAIQWLRWRGCAAGASVTFGVIENHGQGWPGGAQPSDGAPAPLGPVGPWRTDVDATGILLQFFLGSDP
jgi:poly(3-hydroxybutyrate) depolymerase